MAYGGNTSFVATVTAPTTINKGAEKAPQNPSLKGDLQTKWQGMCDGHCSARKGKGM